LTGVIRGVGVGRGCRGVGKPPAEEEDAAEARWVVLAVTGAAGWSPPAGARDVTGVARAVADGEAAGSTGDDGGAERATAAGRGALGAAALWLPSTTARVIATPAATGAPAKTATPDRKLISSMRAFIVLLSRPNPASPLPDIARYRGIGRLGGRYVRGSGVPQSSTASPQ